MAAESGCHHLEYNNYGNVRTYKQPYQRVLSVFNESLTYNFNALFLPLYDPC